YARQIVTLTYPHIGNTGTNKADEESSQIHACGLVIRDLPLITSSFRNEKALDVYLSDAGVVGIANIDTRRLTRILSSKGAQAGCIMAGDVDDAKALELAQSFAGLKGMDLAKEVTTKETYSFTKKTWTLENGLPSEKPATELPHHVVAYDFGIKDNIMRMLVDRGCRLTVVPAQTPASEVLALKPDGIFLSNGPGDPEPCTYAIEAIQEFLKTETPIFGICLGHQLLALASGAKTVKMKFGHHGANHPVQELSSGRVMITAQNHGFAADEATLPANVKATHKSLFDGSLQGLHLTDKPAFSFQGHPEASPGPHDAAPLFNHFIDLIETFKANK
ncbi:MAG: glutamine-hydrolyzing carbamoyl-phosphate synthase small subunit, partial [Psychrobium sp.]|nr:glutamine-hydrolyzing carbamoyl-phosphate synthase small subunit [Psychrobium sp.]